MRKIWCLLSLLSVGHASQAQHTIDQLVASVRTHNRTLQAHQQYVEARQLEAQTGLNPSDPMIEADYMIGRPVSGGDQFDMIAVQSFDFPSSYKRRTELAAARSAMLSSEAAEVRHQVLLEAQLLGLQLIHQNRRLATLERRRATANARFETYRQRFDAAEIGSLDLHKARLHLLSIENELRLAEADRLSLQESLTSLNGGIPFPIADTSYPGVPRMPGFAELEEEVESVDPHLKLLQQQVLTAERELALTKALRLPQMQAGYHFQSVLGQTFNGLHVGFSLPLWERKNTVEASQARILLANSRIEEHRKEHYYHVRDLHARCRALSENLAAYRSVLSELGNEDLLEKMLDLGEIDFIRYADELEYYYGAHDRLLEMELDYHQALARLFKFRL